MTRRQFSTLLLGAVGLAALAGLNGCTIVRATEDGLTQYDMLAVVYGDNPPEGELGFRVWDANANAWTDPPWSKFTQEDGTYYYTFAAGEQAVFYRVNQTA